MIQFQENTQRDGRTEGQTQTDPFHRIFPATARGLTSTTAIDWHFKLFLKHATSQNHPQSAKTTHNQPKPSTTTQNQPKLPTTTQNQPKPPTTKNFHTSGRKAFSSFYLILQFLENNLFNCLRYYCWGISKNFSSVIMTLRSSRSQMFFKIDVPKIFAIFTGKRLCWSLF